MTTRDDRSPQGDDNHRFRDQQEFGVALTRLREQAGLTIRELSRRTGVPSATLGGYFSGRHLPQVAQTDQFARVLAALGVAEPDVAAWLDAVAPLRRTGRGVSRSNPFRGLRPYDVDDGRWFVGREQEVQHLVELADPSGPAAHAPLVLVGASGSGKSSLLRAGLLARLREASWTTRVMVPGQDPERALADAVTSLGESGGLVALAVDQFEEIFAEDVDPAARVRFCQALLDFCAQPDRLVVLSLRADYYREALRLPRLASVIGERQLPVGPISPEQLRRIVTEPAALAGRPVEPELADLVVHDLGRGVRQWPYAVLPLVSHALMTAWDHGDGTQVRVTDYLAVGGVAGAVTSTAEQVYGALDEADQERARGLFSSLVAVEADGHAIRRRIAMDDVVGGGRHDAVIEAFVAGRILTATAHSLEITHDVLLDAWPRLREWIDADREVLLLRRRIGQVAEAWEAGGRDQDALMRGALLAVVRDVGDEQLSALTADERQFVALSLANDEQRRRRDRGRRRRLRSLVVVASGLAVATTGLSVYLSLTIGGTSSEAQCGEGAPPAALTQPVTLPGR